MQPLTWVFCREMSLNCENGYSKKRPQTVASLVLKQKKRQKPLNWILLSILKLINPFKAVGLIQYPRENVFKEY